MIIIKQGTYTGNCATGLTCTNGVCTASASSSNTTTSSVITTTASSANATTTNCTTTSTTAAAGDVCEDTNYNITKTCCSPYTCSNSLSSRTKLCAGSDLAVNDTCFSNGVVSQVLARIISGLDSGCHYSLLEPAAQGWFASMGSVRRQDPVPSLSTPAVSAKERTA